MATRKRQHFIPKLYLKFFSCNGDETTIGLYNLDNNIFKEQVPLKPQAKEDYFYGDDGYLEEQLSKLENTAAPALHKVLATNSLPSRTDGSYFNVFAFTLILSHRTKDVAEEVKEMTDKMWREFMRYDDRFKDVIDNYRIYPKYPAAMALIASAERIPLALDLKAKLLINATPTKFISSDNPVVKYNQFLEQRKHPGGNVGLLTKGLQVFFPLSPTHMLVYYDDWIYKIGDRRKDIVELTNTTDIDTLNYLQVLNCYDHLYFNRDIKENYIKHLVEKGSGQRLKEYTNLHKYDSYVDQDEQEHIFYMSHGYNLEVNLELSFITQTKKAKQHVLSDYAVQLRREELRGKLK